MTDDIWDQKFLEAIRMMKAMVKNMTTKGQPVITMEITDADTLTKTTVIIERMRDDE